MTMRGAWAFFNRESSSCSSTRFASTLMRKVCRQVASGYLVSGTRAPSDAALAMRTSRDFSFFFSAFASARTEVSFSRSTMQTCALPPAASISLRTLSSAAFLRPASSTVAPSFANSFAIARPIPRLAPVTSAVRFCSAAIWILRVWERDGNAGRRLAQAKLKLAARKSQRARGMQRLPSSQPEEARRPRCASARLRTRLSPARGRASRRRRNAGPREYG